MDQKVAMTEPTANKNYPSYRWASQPLPTGREGASTERRLRFFCLLFFLSFSRKKCTLKKEGYIGKDSEPLDSSHFATLGKGGKRSNCYGVLAKDKNNRALASDPMNMQYLSSDI